MLYEIPNLLNFNLRAIHKDDQRWIKFCFWINKLSISAVTGFISAGKWAMDLNQNWLVSNCFACFWNNIKHLIVLRKEYSILQPLREIYLIANSKSQIKPHLMVFKLSMALMNALFHESLNRLTTVSTPPATPFKKPSSRNERERKKAWGATPSITPETNWNPDSIQLWEEANGICDKNLLLLGHSVSDIDSFQFLVPIWVKIQQRLNQPIYLHKFCERFINYKEINLLRAIVIIEVLLATNSNLSDSDITLFSAFENLTTSVSKFSIITLELWSKLAQLSLNAEQHDKVTSCVEYGRINGLEILNQNLNFSSKNKVYLLLSKFESILTLSWYKSSLHIISNELLDQMITACGYADKACNIKFVIYNLKLFWNFCKPMQKKSDINSFLIEKAHIVFSILSNYPKVDRTLLHTITDKDIKTEIFTLFLDAFSAQCSWDRGLHFLELALTQVHRESYSYFVKYIVLFKSKQDINVIMDIVRFSEEIGQLEQSNLYLLAAHASTDCQNKFDCYKGAIYSLNGKENILKRITIKLEFFRWMVMIKFSYKLLVSLLEEALGELVEYVIERLVYQRGGCTIMENKEPSVQTESCDSGMGNTFSLDILDNFEEWTLNEIDYFFQILMLLFILHGKSSYQKCELYLKLLIFCTYSMLKLALIKNTEVKITIHDQGKKGKILTKPKIDESTLNASLPNNFLGWSKYFPSHNNLTLSTTDQSTLLEYSLKSPNLTLYYLNHLNKVLKVSTFSHFQLFPLALMNVISLACDNCPRGWSKLSFIGLLDCAKRFNFDSFEFWKSKLDGNYFAQEDLSFLLETTLIDFEQCISPSMSIRSNTSSLYLQNAGHLITFHKTHFIIFIAFEISSLLLELKNLQPTIDIVNECEEFLKVFPSNIFDFQMYDLKARINVLYLGSIVYKEDLVIVQNSLFSISEFLGYSLSLCKLLEYPSAIQYLENVIHLMRKFQEENRSSFYNHIQVSFEIELATRHLNYYLSHSSQDINIKRVIIDVDISMELLYSCFCLLNASHNYIDSNYALKKYVYFLDQFAIDNGYLFSHTSYFTSVNKTLSCYKRIIDLNQEIIVYVVSVSLDFDIKLDKDSSIHSELVDSHLSLATFCMSKFQVCLDLINSEKLQVNKYSQSDKYVNREPSSSNIFERSMPNNFSLIICSITTLGYLQSISSCHLIEYELGRAMISLYYYYYDQDVFDHGPYTINDTNQLVLKSHFTKLEYDDNEYSHSRAILYFASGIRYFQKYLLKYIKSNISNLLTLQDICYRFLALIGYYDRKQSAHFLALYQSFSCSSYFKSIIAKLFDNHSDSKLAAFNSIDNNNSLQSVYSRLNVLPNFFEFIKEMPSNFRYLILQHSIDMSTLYFAYTQQSPSQKANKGAMLPIDWLPIYGHCKVNPNTIPDIIIMLNDFTELTRMYDCNKIIIDSVKNEQISSHAENIFQDIKAAINAYFNCIIPLIEPIIYSETNPQNLILFILCDENILSLPIEVIFNLPPFNIYGQISRDFSLQILNHRFTSLQYQNKESLKDKSKESFPPFNSELDHDVFDITNTCYYIDPYDSFESPSNVNEECQTMLRKSFGIHQKLTNKWNGILGTTNFQSLYEKWNAFKADNILFFLPGLFNFHFPLDLLISTSYSKRYNLILLFDKIFDKYTNYRIFNDYLPTKIQSDTVIAGLLSIIGCNVVVMNMRPMNCYLLTNMLTCFFNCLLKEGYSVSRAIQYINNRQFSTEEQADQRNSTHMASSFITFGLSYSHTL